MAPTGSESTGTENLTDSGSSKAKATKVIAEWKGTDASPRVDGRTAREISKKDAKDNPVVDLSKDLRWGPENSYRVDVTDEPEAFHKFLKDNGFKLTEE